MRERIHFDRGSSSRHPSMRRRTARVPKGLLRHYVLKLLDEQPMSGSEIMTTISKRTEDRWEPSPGSVYPLLSWLKDSKYIIIESEESGIKRYSLTKAGKKFLEEHDEKHPDFDETLSDPGPRYRGDLSRYPEEVQELFKDFRRLRRTSGKLLKRIKKEYSEELVKEAHDALRQFREKLKELADTPLSETGK